MPDRDSMTTWYICHGMYGCECGCCGYFLSTDIEGYESDTDAHRRDDGPRHMTFDHPHSGESPDDFARRIWDVPVDVTIIPGNYWACL